MKWPRPQFGIRTLLAVVAFCAFLLWAWPAWWRYRALRRLSDSVASVPLNSSIPVKGGPGGNRIPDYARLEATSTEVRRVHVVKEAVAALADRLKDKDRHVCATLPSLLEFSDGMLRPHFRGLSERWMTSRRSCSPQSLPWG